MEEKSMLNKPTVDELLNKATNRYELTIAISKRARQIISGDEPKIKTDEKSKVTISALELANGKYSIRME